MKDGRGETRDRKLEIRDERWGWKIKNEILFVFDYNKYDK